MAVVTSIIREDAKFIVDEMAIVLQPLRESTVLITGAAGFLGAFLLDVLAALNADGRGNPCRVIAVDNFKTGLGDRIGHLKRDPNFTFIKHDVSQPLEGSIRADWIVHGAGIASPMFYRQFPLETIDVNVSGTRHMLDVAHRTKSRGMAYFSTSEIYGDPSPDWTPTPENYRGSVSCTGPRACYDESKRLAETLSVVYHQLHGTPVKIIRPFNVYGPGQRLDDKRIIPDLMTAAMKRKPIILYSDGRATRSFCYVRDFIRGTLHVLLRGAAGEAYNVGNDAEVSIGLVAAKVAEIAGPPSLTVEHRLSHDTSYLTDNPQRRCPDLTKLRSMANWQPVVGLEEGLVRTLTSYREDAAKESEK